MVPRVFAETAQPGHIAANVTLVLQGRLADSETKVLWIMLARLEIFPSRETKFACVLVF